MSTLDNKNNKNGKTCDILFRLTEMNLTIIKKQVNHQISLCHGLEHMLTTITN